MHSCRPLRRFRTGTILRGTLRRKSFPAHKYGTSEAGIPPSSKAATLCCTSQCQLILCAIAVAAGAGAAVHRTQSICVLDTRPTAAAFFIEAPNACLLCCSCSQTTPGKSSLVPWQRITTGSSRQFISANTVKVSSGGIIYRRSQRSKSFAVSGTGLKERGKRVRMR